MYTRSSFPTRLLPTVCVLALVATSINCDRKTETPPKPQMSAAAIDVSPTATPAQPSLADASSASTKEPIPAPTTSFMMIDQKRVDFPAAKLRLADAGGNKVIAKLFSDDPEDALRDTYTGHSFYFEMDLDLPSPDQIGDGRWDFRASSDDRDDTPFGIFLDGHKRQLQPLEVVIDFDSLQENPTKLTTVSISGRFLLIDLKDENAPQKTVTVKAQFVANTSIKK